MPNNAVSLLNLGEMWFDLDWMAFHEAEAQNQEALSPDLLRKVLWHTTCILTQTQQTVLGSSTEPCSREAYKAVFPVLTLSVASLLAYL